MATVTIIELADYVIDDIGDTELTTDQVRALVKKAILRINRKLTVAGISSTITLDADECKATISADADVVKDLVVLQTECIIATRNYMESVSKGIRIRSGTDEVDTTAGFGGQNAVVKAVCGELQTAIADFVETQINSNVEDYASLIWYGEQRKYEDVDHDGQYDERRHPFDCAFDDEESNNL